MPFFSQKYQWYYLSILIGYGSMIYGASYNILFVQLGDTIPPCIFTVMQQAKHLNPKANLHLLTDETAYNLFKTSYQDNLRQVHLVNMSDIPKTYEHLTFLKTNKIKGAFSRGFWKFTLERFFYLFDFIKEYDLKNNFHLENDSMLYINLEELLPIFEISNIQIAAPFLSATGCVPCFVFIKDILSFSPLINHSIAEMRQYKGRKPELDVNDMQILASFYRKFGDFYMTPLPVLMPEYAKYHPKRQSFFKPDNQTSLAFLSMNAFLFPGYLFDAAALGILINGNDRKYFPDNGPGTIHHRSLFNPGHFTFFWDKDSLENLVPYLFFKTTKYRIVNMHFHSKMPEGYTSYGNNQKPFIQYHDSSNPSDTSHSN